MSINCKQLCRIIQSLQYKANKIRGYQASRIAQYNKIYNDDIANSLDSYETIRDFSEYLENLHPYLNEMKTVETPNNSDENPLQKMCLAHVDNGNESHIWLIGVYSNGGSLHWSKTKIWSKEGDTEQWPDVESLGELNEIKIDDEPVIFSNITDVVFIGMRQSDDGVFVRFDIIGLKDSIFQTVIVEFPDNDSGGNSGNNNSGNNNNNNSGTSNSPYGLISDAYYESSLNQTSSLSFLTASVGSSISGTLTSELVGHHDFQFKLTNKASSSTGTNSDTTCPDIIFYNKCITSPTVYWTDGTNNTMEFYVKSNETYVNAKGVSFNYDYKLTISSSGKGTINTGVASCSLKLTAERVVVSEKVSEPINYNEHFKFKLDNYHKTLRLYSVDSGLLLMYSSLSPEFHYKVALKETTANNSGNMIGYINFAITIDELILPTPEPTPEEGQGVNTAANDAIEPYTATIVSIDTTDETIKSLAPFHYHSNLPGEWTGNAIFTNGISYELTHYLKVTESSSTVSANDIGKSFLEHLDTEAVVIATGYTSSKQFALAEFSNSEWKSKSFSCSGLTKFQSMSTKSFTESRVESADIKWADYVDSLDVRNDKGEKIVFKQDTLMNVYQTVCARTGKTIMVYESKTSDKTYFIVVIPDEPMIKFQATSVKSPIVGIQLLSGHRLAYTKRWFKNANDTYVESIHQTIMCVSNVDGKLTSIMNTDLSESWEFIDVGMDNVDYFGLESYKLVKPDSKLTNEHHGFVIIANDKDDHMLARGYNQVSNEWIDVFGYMFYPMPFCNVVNTPSITYSINGSGESKKGVMGFKWSVSFGFYDKFVTSASFSTSIEQQDENEPEPTEPTEPTEPQQDEQLTSTATANNKMNFTTSPLWSSEEWSKIVHVSGTCKVGSKTSILKPEYTDITAKLTASDIELNASEIKNSRDLYYTRTDSNDETHIMSEIIVYKKSNNEVVASFTVTFEFKSFNVDWFRAFVIALPQAPNEHSDGSVDILVDETKLDNTYVQFRNDVWQRFITLGYETKIDTKDDGTLDSITIKLDSEEIPTNLTFSTIPLSPTVYSFEYTYAGNSTMQLAGVMNQSSNDKVTVEQHLINKCPTFVLKFGNETFSYESASVSVIANLDTIVFTINAIRVKHPTIRVKSTIRSNTEITLAISVTLKPPNASDEYTPINLRTDESTKTVIVYVPYPKFDLVEPEMCAKNNIGICYDDDNVMIIPFTNNIYALEEVRAPLMQDVKADIQ